MKLVNKKLFKHNESEYYIDVTKDCDIMGTMACNQNYYTYGVTIHSKNIKKRFFRTKYKYLYFFRTYWLDYYKFEGDIDKVVEKAISMYEWNLREQKYINEKEKEYVKECKN